MGRIGGAVLAGVAVLALAACERGARAPSRAQRDGGGASASSDASSSSYGGSRPRDEGGSGGEGGGYRSASRDEGAAPREREATPDFHGKPMWADNRRHTARENAEYQCGKHGEDIASKSLDDCLTKVHAFVDNPPSGVETAIRERNGDKLLYDARSNMFAVARKDGAPRTFFKPREGADFWRGQKEEAQSGRRRSSGFGEGDRTGGDG